MGRAVEDMVVMRNSKGLIGRYRTVAREGGSLNRRRIRASKQIFFIESICPTNGFAHSTHGCIASRLWRADPTGVISDLLELRITSSGAPAQPDILVTYYAHIEHICEREPVHADPRNPRTRSRSVASRLRRHGGAPISANPKAAARMERDGRTRDGASLRAHQGGDPAGRVAVLRALRQGDQRAQGGARRRDPGAQLPDPGDLQLRRRFR